MGTKVYDPKDVHLIFGGVLIEDYADGDDVIMVDHDADTATERVGVTGEVVVSVNHNRAGEVRVKLLRGSRSNDLLQALLAVYRRTGTLVPMLLKDARGRELHECNRAYIKKQPSSGHGSNASAIEWTIRCPRLNSFLGGLN